MFPGRPVDTREGTLEFLLVDPTEDPTADDSPENPPKDAPGEQSEEFARITGTSVLET